MVASYPRTIPLNLGGDPDRGYGFRIQNIILLKSLSTQSLFLHAPYVDHERSESLCGETHNGKWWHQHAIVWRTTMESADVSMPLFDAQQWKVRTSACRPLFDAQQWKCKSLSTETKWASVWRVSLEVVLTKTSRYLPGSLSRRVSGYLKC